MHGRCDPNFLIGVHRSVYGDFCVPGLEVTQKAFDGNGRIVDLLAGCLFHFIARLTAVSVKAEAYAVEKKIVFSVYFYTG